MAKYYTLAQLEAVLKAAPALLQATRTFSKAFSVVTQRDLTPKADISAAKKLSKKLNDVYGAFEDKLNGCDGDFIDVCSDLEDRIEELEQEDEDVQFAVMKGGRIIKTVEAPYKPKRGEKLIPMDE